MVTAGTYRKEALFNSKSKLDLLQARLFASALACELSLQAWAIFPNHYHLIVTLNEAKQMKAFVRGLHSNSAREINRLDNTRARKVWFQSWESRITFERSYFPRLRYVHENAVRHGVVRVATNYNWCSASWFVGNSTAAFRKTVLSFGCDAIRVQDDFAVIPEQYLSE